MILPEKEAHKSMQEWEMPRRMIKIIINQGRERDQKIWRKNTLKKND